MADTLFPVVDVPELVDDDGLYDYKYHPSVTWDMEKGDFVLDGSNRLVECSGEEAYKIWCIKAVSTERYECLAYSDEIGAEMESAMQEKDAAAVESAVERTITETLLVNPRTQYVRDFAFEREGSALYCTFVVKGIDYEEFRATIKVVSKEGGADG